MELCKRLHVQENHLAGLSRELEEALRFRGISLAEQAQYEEYVSCGDTSGFIKFRQLLLSDQVCEFIHQRRISDTIKKTLLSIDLEHDCDILKIKRTKAINRVRHLAGDIFLHT